MNKNFNHSLQEYGLTQREADIYQTLLSLGESPIKDLIKATGHHPQVIYRALAGLEKKRIVTVNYRHQKRYITPEDPQILQEAQEQRLQTIKELLPDLQSLQKLPPTSIVRVEKGPEALRKLRIAGVEALKKGETYYVIGGAAKYFYEIMGPVFAQLEKKRLKKGVKRKMITYGNQREFVRRYEPVLPEGCEYRYLPSSYDVVSGVNFYKDTVAIIIWSLDPIVITIKSKEIVTSYKQTFENLWRIAQK